MIYLIKLWREAKILLIKLVKLLFLEGIVVNEELMKAQLKLVELNEWLMLIKSDELDHSYLTGDIEKVNHELEIILDRFRP